MPEGDPDGGPVPTHGGVSASPAEQLATSAGWEEGLGYVLRVSGVIREAAAFGTNRSHTNKQPCCLRLSGMFLIDLDCFCVQSS